MQDGGGLLDLAEEVAGGDLVAYLGSGDKVPLLLPVQRRDLDAAGDAGAAALGHDRLQRTLDTVVDVLQQAGTKLHGQGRAGGDDLSAGAEAGGLFVDLDGGGVAGHGQDLADEPLLTDADHVGHIGIGHTGGDHQRAGNLDNFAHCLEPSFV